MGNAEKDFMQKSMSHFLHPLKSFLDNEMKTIVVSQQKLWYILLRSISLSINSTITGILYNECTLNMRIEPSNFLKVYKHKPKFVNLDVIKVGLHYIIKSKDNCYFLQTFLISFTRTVCLNDIFLLYLSFLFFFSKNVLLYYFAFVNYIILHRKKNVL